jgi:hypothetical protein
MLKLTWAGCKSSSWAESCWRPSLVLSALFSVCSYSLCATTPFGVMYLD